jgi:hypothetical protein
MPSRDHTRGPGRPPPQRSTGVPAWLPVRSGSATIVRELTGRGRAVTQPEDTSGSAPGSAPGYSAPTPDAASPHQAYAYPGQPYPGPPYPGQPYPGPAYPSQSYPGQPYPGPAYPGQPYPGPADPGQSHPGQPYPGPPAARQSRTGLWITLGAGVLVLFVAVAVAAFAVVRIAARPAQGAEPNAAESGLLGLVLPMPSGATAETTEAGPDGTLDQDELAKWYGDQVYGRELLDAHGFVAAVRRAWTTSDGVLVQITLVQFGEPSRAYSFAADWVNAILDTNEPAQAQLAGMEIGRYAIAKEPDNDGDYAVVSVFAKRNVVGVINGWYPSSPPPDTVIQMATDQHARLP